MESTNSNRKIQSDCELCEIEKVGRKESSLNPYNLSICPKMTLKWPPPETTKDVGTVNSLPGFECGVFPKSYTDACSCCPESSSDEIDYVATREDGCCELTWIRKDTYQRIKSKVEKAVKKHKIFLIRGELPKLRQALEGRGWVQKYESSKTRTVPYGGVSTLEAHSLGNINQQDGRINEKALIFTLLRHRPPDFIWDCRNDFINWHRSVGNNTILNKYQRSFVYTSKLGMARLLEDAHWLHEKNVSSVLFPRSYNLSRDPGAFLEDFRRTAASSLLKWFVEKRQAGENVHNMGERSIPFNRLEFALKRCEEYTERAKHLDIDLGNADVPESEWNLFLDDYTAVIHNGNGIENPCDGGQDRVQKCFVAAVAVLKKLKSLDPQFELNGTRNMWILKPSALCCGSGISIYHHLKDIFRKVQERSKDYFIVQKYIERPLLILGTKFDIRQWYLVTNTYPLTIWLFKEALLRFSSKPYTYSTYHEAIHICNTAIQEKYDSEKRRKKKFGGSVQESEKSVRDQGWDCEKLNEYLKHMGYGSNAYYDKIYPKMAESIVLTMLAAQEHMERRRCSFELYGADFMVMDDLSVWLIEINTNPRMHPPSSNITKRLYSNVLESLVKVIIDLPLDKSADTGGFSLVYEQSLPDFRPYLGPCLFVFGKSMTLHEHPRKQEKERKTNICNPWGKQHRGWAVPPTIARLREPRVVDFIDYLNNARCTDLCT